ncbi:SDR family oxidoreductase [Thiobacillus sedimenti]|uniref:SDR family oxidoreductase n=1 Tax=Thiobacillus sedimenti TaxID=3110231 RepID=A0ABZ1CLY0_9PROT|nr:SDR family oxidoreductase [Thiobacillus sp. SCUT-2]WRS40394.1 SDR family oxidoreductase [Thiobacillus sp. SCUT-2]
MPCVLITGASRGLGLEWARQYAEAGWQVLATCRRPEEADALRELAARHASVGVHRLDVTDSEQLRTLQLDLADLAVDILLNNAGVYLDKFMGDLGGLDYEVWLRSFAVNTLGAVRVTEAFAGQVARSERKLVVAISSHMGAIAEIAEPGHYAYRSSKAALNAAMKGIAQALAPRGIGVLLLHPGWVGTRMGGSQAMLTPAQSVRAMRALVDHFGPGMNGRFLRFNGSEIPW